MRTTTTAMPSTAATMSCPEPALAPGAAIAITADLLTVSADADDYGCGGAPGGRLGDRRRSAVYVGSRAAYSSENNGSSVA